MVGMVARVRWPWSRKQRVEFDSTPRPIADLFLEMSRASGTTVTRTEALSVPAVRRGRNMLCAISTMPLEQVGADNRVERSPFLEQIDLDVPNVVTIAQTIEDLVFSGVSWWLVTSTDFAGYPMSARHLDVSSVSVDPPKGRTAAPLPSGLDPREGVVWIDGQAVGGSRVIRFDSPNPALLKHAGREIRRAVLLDKAAAMYADDPRPADYFEPAEGAEEVSDTEVEEILAKWKAARKKRGTAYVPASLKYHSVDAPAPRELQLAELQKQVGLDIANSMGIDPEDLGISTTSRTYANDVDRRRNRLNDVLAPYMRAITDRLSMGDVTKRGRRVRLNPAEYLQPNPTDRWGVYTQAAAMEAMTVEEMRQAEGLPPLPAADPAAGGTASVTAARELQLVEQIQKIYLGVGTVITAAEAREILNRSGAGLDVDAPVAGPPPAPVAAPADEPVEETDSVDASRPAAMTFDDSRALTFVDVPVETFSVDRENRIIEGLALPYGQVGQKGGMRFKFEPGALQWTADSPSRVKLVFPGHGEAVGKAIQLRNTGTGLLTRFKVGRGREGDRALESADDGVHDGFSVGVDFDTATDATPDPRDRTLLHVHRADLRHVALTAEPVFDNARVTRVAADRTTGGPAVADASNDQAVPAEGNGATTTDSAPAVTLSQDQLTAVLSRPGAIQAIVSAQQPTEPETPATSAGGLELSADQVDGLIRSGALGALLGLPGAVGAPAVDEGPTPVNPQRPLELSVTEPQPYTFDRDGNLRAGSHDFSSDLIAAGRDHDQAAHDRAMSFIEAQFAVATTDVNELNPNIQRPDLFVDQVDYTYPLWMAINRGGLGSVTPFVVPKFNSSSGLVGDHTEGTEPTTGTYTVTSQTITPTALSGKATINREAWDQGGNPQLSGLVWAQMVREWNEELEAATATFLNTLTAATDIALATAAVDEALASSWDAAMAALQFVRGGHRFSMFGVHIDLYKAFVDARDSSGRPLYPMLNPQNSNGTATPRFGLLDLGGVTGVPSWALGSSGTVSANSWLFNPADVHGWASAPQRLQFEYQVSSVEIGIWGYKAFANTRIDGVRQVTYDPSTLA